MDISDAAAILSTSVAVILGIYTIYTNYERKKEKEPKVISKVAVGFLQYGRELRGPTLNLEVINPGEKKVRIVSVTVKYKDLDLIFPAGIEGTQRLPFELLPGENATFWLPIFDVVDPLKEQGAKGKAKIQACFRDAVGNMYLSKRTAISLDGWQDIR